MMDGPGGPRQTMTDENGEYSFTELGPGQYNLSEEQRAGWVQTWPPAENDGAHVVDLAADEQNDDVNFGNQQFGSIKVVKYIDVDGDGVLDEMEPFADGWEITMGETTVLTDENGEVLFENLPPGNEYSVSEEMREGWANKNDVYQVDDIEVLPVAG